MIGLLWGGTRFAWHGWRIILLFVLFATLSVGFGYVQYRQQDKAILPPRIVENRTVLACAVYACCTNGILVVTEYYIAIYFQGVRGYSAAKEGLLGLPMLVGLRLTSLVSSVGAGCRYYTRKLFDGTSQGILTRKAFLFATSIFAPGASGSTQRQ